MSDEKRSIQNSYYKFMKTPDSSLISYLMILADELRKKAEETEDTNERFWYYDASTLVAETLFRYDGLRFKKGKHD